MTKYYIQFMLSIKSIYLFISNNLSNLLIEFVTNFCNTD